MKNKKYTKASYTIEAALIMPTILIVILGLIYLSFYLHDYNKLTTMLHNTCIKSALIIRHKGSIVTGEVDYNNLNSRQIYWRNLDLSTERTLIKDYLTDILDNGLFITEVIDTDLIISIETVKVSITAKVYIPILSIKRLFTSKDTFTVHITAETQVHEPTEFIRISDLLIELGSNIKGVDESIENIKKLLEKAGK